VAQPAGLLLREHDHLDRLLGEALRMAGCVSERKRVQVLGYESQGFLRDAQAGAVAQKSA